MSERLGRVSGGDDEDNDSWSLSAGKPSAGKPSAVSEYDADATAEGISHVTVHISANVQKNIVDANLFMIDVIVIVVVGGGSCNYIVNLSWYYYILLL